jgi:hypothetical protein
VNPSQEVAHALLERLVAVRAAKAAGSAKVAERRRAERAARGVTLRRLHLLMNALKEVGDVRLRRRECGFNSTLRRAPLAEVEQTYARPLDLG